MRLLSGESVLWLALLCLPILISLLWVFVRNKATLAILRLFQGVVFAIEFAILTIYLVWGWLGKLWDPSQASEAIFEAIWLSRPREAGYLDAGVAIPWLKISFGAQLHLVTAALALGGLLLFLNQGASFATRARLFASWNIAVLASSPFLNLLGIALLLGELVFAQQGASRSAAIQNSRVKRRLPVAAALSFASLLSGTVILCTVTEEVSWTPIYRASSLLVEQVRLWGGHGPGLDFLPVAVTEAREYRAIQLVGFFYLIPWMIALGRGYSSSKFPERHSLQRQLAQLAVLAPGLLLIGLINSPDLFSSPFFAILPLVFLIFAAERDAKASLADLRYFAVLFIALLFIPTPSYAFGTAALGIVAISFARVAAAMPSGGALFREIARGFYLVAFVLGTANCTNLYVQLLLIFAAMLLIVQRLSSLQSNKAAKESSQKVELSFDFKAFLGFESLQKIVVAKLPLIAPVILFYWAAQRGWTGPDNLEFPWGISAACGLLLLAFIRHWRRQLSTIRTSADVQETEKIGSAASDLGRRLLSILTMKLSRPLLALIGAVAMVAVFATITSPSAAFSFHQEGENWDFYSAPGWGQKHRWVVNGHEASLGSNLSLVAPASMNLHIIHQSVGAFGLSDQSEIYLGPAESGEMTVIGVDRDSHGKFHGTIETGEQGK